jgi:hypothetical protein
MTINEDSDDPTADGQGIIETRILVATGHIPGGTEVGLSVSSGVGWPDTMERAAEELLRKGLINRHPDATDIETKWYDSWMPVSFGDNYEEEAPE